MGSMLTMRKIGSVNTHTAVTEIQTASGRQADPQYLLTQSVLDPW